MLISKSTSTYIGYTNNLTRRVRQHNGEIKGGAKSTHGKKWQVVKILGPYSRKKAMSVEWQWKQCRGCKSRIFFTKLE